jgi:hypothetical protein
MTRSERKQKAEIKRNLYAYEISKAITDALDKGVPIREAYRAGGRKEAELKIKYPQDVQLITQGAAIFISDFRKEALLPKEERHEG